MRSTRTPMRASPRRACIPIETRVDGLVAAAVATDFARNLGLTRAQTQRIALAAGELGTNVQRHGGGGRVELCFDGRDVEVWGYDRGPGLGDAHPHANAGWGLEAIGRAMDSLQSGREPSGCAWVRCTLRVAEEQP